MGYNVIDILNKGIDVNLKRKAMIESIRQKKCDIPSMKVMSNVLIKQVDKTIQYYEQLKKEVKPEECDEIDFVIYDKISFLINEFNKRLYVPEVYNTRDFLSFSLHVEQDLYSLLIDIQGRLVKSTNALQTDTYKILSKAIKNISDHIETLKSIIQ
jgi:hypothetical protein